MEMTVAPAAFYELSLFGGMSPEEVDAIGRLATLMRVPAGSPLFLEGEQAAFLDIIWSGQVEIGKLDRDGNPQLIAHIHAPGVVGEMSVLSHGSRSCTGIAVTELEVYRIAREDFTSLLEAGHLAAYKVVLNLGRVMSARLRAIDEKVVSLLTTSKEVEAVETPSEFAAFRTKLFSEWVF